MNLTDRQIAELPDHEAVPLGLPRRIEAWLVLRMEGRIESDAFSVSLSLEPQQYAHAWINYRRDGAIVTIGQRRWRLTPQQLIMFAAVERLTAAGQDVAARLRAWPDLMKALVAVRGGQVRAEGDLPQVLLKEVGHWPEGSSTRIGTALFPASRATQATWAMGPGHRYYLKAA